MGLRRSILAAVTGRYIGLAIQLVASMIISRILAPSEIGVFGLAASIIALSGNLREFGVGNYLLQADKLTTEAIARAQTLMMTISLTVAAVLWLSRGWIADYFGEPRLASLIELILLGYLLAPIGSASAAMLQREMAFTTVQVIQLTSTTIGMACSVVLALRGFSFYSLAWGQIVGMALSILMLTALRPRGVFVLPKFSGWGPMLSFGLFSTLTNCVGSLSSQLVTTVIARRLDMAALGHFDRANGLINVLAVDFTNAIMQVIYVGLSRAKHSPDEFSAIYVRSLANITGVIWPACIVLSLVAPSTIFVLFGPGWEESGAVLRVGILSGLFITCNVLNYRVLMSLGLTGSIFAIEGIVGACRILATLALVPFGLVMVTVAGIFASAVGMMLYWRQVRRVLRIERRRVVQALVQSSAITMAAVMLPLAIVTFDAVAKLPLLVMLGGVGVSAAVSWIGAVFLVRHPLHEEIILLIRRFTG